MGQLVSSLFGTQVLVVIDDNDNLRRRFVAVQVTFHYEINFLEAGSPFTHTSRLDVDHSKLIDRELNSSLDTRGRCPKACSLIHEIRTLDVIVRLANFGRLPF
jgi:hypothetical protein